MKIPAFWGFASHAHTLNELVIDQEEEKSIRNANTPEKGEELAQKTLGELKEKIKGSGFQLTDIRLLVLLVSYRGNSDNDRKILTRILEVIQRELKPPKLIGHTTAGEFLNRDLCLGDDSTSGIGYNGLSILAIGGGIPIGIALSEGLTDPVTAHDGGEYLVRKARNDLFKQEISEQLRSKLRKETKLFLLLTQGGKASVPSVKPPKTGYEHFLVEGMVDGIVSEKAKVERIFGGSSGDGCIGTSFFQFYGNLERGDPFKLYKNSAVCALIPIFSSLRLAGEESAATSDVSLHECRFHFSEDPELEYMLIESIEGVSPISFFARTIYDNEKSIGNLPLLTPNELETWLRTLEGFPIQYPFLCKYSFVFEDQIFPVYPIRAKPEDNKWLFEITHPVEPLRARLPRYEITGKIVIGDAKKIKKGAGHISRLLENENACTQDIVFLISCVSRRLVEKDYYEPADPDTPIEMEATIFRREFLETQLIGFLSYGEISVGVPFVKPYHFNFTAWGLRLGSIPTEKEEQSLARQPMMNLEEEEKGKPTIGIITASRVIKFKEETDSILSKYQQPIVVEDAHRIVENILLKFHLVVREISERHEGRHTLEIADEYDVQDLLRGLLRQYFDDVRDEVWTPEYAGSSARIDFLLPKEQIAIEVKKTRKGLGKKKLGDQLIIDIAHYQKNPECKTLYCFIYDPEEKISNPRGFERDLTEKHGDLLTKVFIVPKRA